MQIKKFIMDKKGQAVTIGKLAAIGVTLVVAVLVLMFGARVADDVQDNFVADETNLNCVVGGNQHNCTSAGFNLTQRGVEGLSNLTGQFPSVGTVLGAALIIGILATAFFIKSSGVSFK